MTSAIAMTLIRAYVPVISHRPIHLVRAPDLCIQLPCAVCFLFALPDPRCTLGDPPLCPGTLNFVNSISRLSDFQLGLADRSFQQEIER